jgi:hypothetical protein
MKKISIVGAALFASCGVALAAGPFDAMKGKMKEGLYEYKMDVDMPNMPAGMKMPTQTIQKCVTAKELDEGNFARGANQKQDCEIKDVNFSGNNGSYKMVCNGTNPMTADVKMVFRDNGFTSDMNMTMNQGGQQMHMKQHLDGTYKGACSK